MRSFKEFANDLFSIFDFVGCITPLFGDFYENSTLYLYTPILFDLAPHDYFPGIVYQGRFSKFIIVIPYLTDTACILTAKFCEVYNWRVIPGYFVDYKTDLLSIVYKPFF